MSTRKTSLVYTLLILVSGLAVGMVIASRLDLTSESAAQNFSAPPMNSAPITGTLDAQTFRNVAKAQSPIVVTIKTESRQRRQDLSDFFGGGGGGAPADLLRRFFDQQPGAPAGLSALPGEQYFNRTEPQRFNAAILGPPFDPGSGQPVMAGQGVPLAGFPEGEYRLLIRIMDRRSGRSLDREVAFTVQS